MPFRAHVTVDKLCWRRGEFKDAADVDKPPHARLCLDQFEVMDDLQVITQWRK